jgi:hypothetical protein
MRTAVLGLGMLLGASAARAEPYIIVLTQPAAHVFDVCGEWWCATWLATQPASGFACVIHISSTLSAGFRAEIETEMRGACNTATLAGVE